MLTDELRAAEVSVILLCCCTDGISAVEIGIILNFKITYQHGESFKLK